MNIEDKVKKWLDNLRLFAVNSAVHCSREEKVLKQEQIGTRNVYFAFNEMIKHMHSDFNIEWENVINESAIIEGGSQILLFGIGDNYFYSDISVIHEVISYPSKNYNEISISNNNKVIALLNWYEGLIPVIQTDIFLNESQGENNFLLVCDIGKEIFAFSVSTIYQKHEIYKEIYSSDIEVDGRVFRFLDFGKYEDQLVNLRMNLKL